MAKQKQLSASSKIIASPYGTCFKKGQKVYFYGDSKTFGFIKEWDYSNGTWLLQTNLGDDTDLKWWAEDEPTIKFVL